MINELTILENLQTTIQEHLNEFLVSQDIWISGKDVALDFPDPDQMKDSKMLYIVPDYVNYEALATRNDQSEFRITVFVLCKRNTATNLATQVFAYSRALYQTVRKYKELGGIVDFTDVNSMDFYPAVDLNKSVQGMEISLTVRYTKDF